MRGGEACVKPVIISDPMPHTINANGATIQAPLFGLA